ncbi:hypothetical protein D3C80_1311000 [compost metagenome]
MAGLAAGGHQFAHQRVAEGQDQAGDEHAQRDGEDAGHDAERHVLVVALVEHRQAHGDREHDGRAAHETGDQRHHQRFFAGGQGRGQVIAAHVRGDDHGRRQRRVGAQGAEKRAECFFDDHGQVGDGGHDARRRHEDVARGVDAFHEFFTKPFIAVVNRREGTEYGAEHDEIEHVIADLIHCVVLSYCCFLKRGCCVHD